MIATMAVAPAGPAHVAEAPASPTEVLAQLRGLAGVPDLRLRVTDDRRVALIDVAMLFTGKTNKDAADAVKDAIQRHPEVSEKIRNLGKHKFEGPGQKPTHVAPIAVAIA